MNELKRKNFLKDFWLKDKEYISLSKSEKSIVRKEYFKQNDFKDDKIQKCFEKIFEE